jgi:putative transposase
VIRKVAGACPAGREFPVYFLVVETQKKGRGMQFSNSTFVQLLKPINRRQFTEIVERHGGNAYDKSFKSWDHLVTLIYAQFTCTTGLRGLTETWNASPQHHYHLGSQVRLNRSTVADANQRRPVAVFADTFSLVASQLDSTVRREGKEMVRILDSTPIPLGKLCDWAKSNGRIRGMKVHVVYDPKSDCPRVLDMTDANVNDAQIGRTVAIETGATYVFDKGYCHYGWWCAIHDAQSFFVTRPKISMKLKLVADRPVVESKGDGFTVLEDSEVKFASKGDSKLPMRLRRVRVKRHKGGGTIVLLTNDLERSAVEIAALYKGRWQIELLFRWMKQHLKIRKFLGNNDNAIRLQLLAAMIAFALLRIAARTFRVTMSILRFTDLIAQFIFERRNLAAIDKPPPVNPSKRRDRSVANQLSLAYV